MVKEPAYRILEKIGEDGMGAVYRARDIRLQRDVAIKVLRVPTQRRLSPEKVQEIRERFRKEAQAAARLNHPYIVSIFQVGRTKNRDFIVMEYLRGRTLHEVMREGMPLKRVLRILIQVCEALEYAHRQGVVHRDIKPDNIVLTEEDRVKITDFGIARVEGLDPPRSHPGVMLGSPGYCAPEQLRDFGREDRRADLFSVGVILYQWLTGKLPFEGETTGEIIAEILNGEPKPVGEWNPAVPESLQKIVHKALAKSPEDRFQHASELREALEGVLKEMEEEEDVRGSEPTRPLKLAARRSIQLPVVVMVPGIMGVLLYGWIALRGDQRILDTGSKLRGTHMARMLEVVGVDDRSPESLKILEGYLAAIGREEDIVLLEVVRGDKALAKFSDPARIPAKGDVHIRSFPLRMESGEEARLLVGFSKAHYNRRVARIQRFLLVGLAFFSVLLAGTILYARGWFPRKVRT